jgi:gliding motility-associated-like protein
MKNYILSFFIILLVFKSSAQIPISLSPASNGQTFNTCFGFIIDSGGQGGPGYSNNESSTITICPDTPGEIISVQFNTFSLNTTDDNPAPNQSNVDYMYVYDGTSTAANSLGVYSGNQLQGVVIQATVLNPTGCITLTFTSNTVGTGLFTASVQCETPCNNPFAGAAIVGGITSDSIRVCVGESVNFQNSGSIAQPGFSLVDYEWDFMDGTTGNGILVSHAYNVPGQYRVNLFVTDDNGCSNPNLTDLVVLVGTYPDFTGFPSDTTLCIGQSVTFTADPESYEVLWNGFPGSQSIDDGCLPDTLLGVSQNVELLQTGFAAGTSITNISQIESVCLELEHSFMGDIVIILECPNGQNVILHQQGGGGTQIGIPVQEDNVDCSNPATQGVPFQYCFTPTATQTWMEWVGTGFGGTIPAGDYESIQPLDNLVGCPTNGVWTLSVVDNWAADDGTLFSFSLNLDPSLYPPISQFEPQIGLGADSSYWSQPAPYLTNLSGNADVLTIAPAAAGSYTYTYNVVDDFGCAYDTSLTVIVNQNPIIFAGNDTTLCGGNGLQLNGMLDGSGAVSDCIYELVLEDDFGDGWNGNTLTVNINGVNTNYTLTSGTSTSFFLTIPSGTIATFNFNANGSWVEECIYTLLDENGNTMFTEGPFLAGVTTNTYTANCAGDWEYNWSPSAGLSDPNILDPTFTLTTPVTLTLTINPVGFPECSVSDDIYISLSANPDAGTDGAISLCSSAAPVDLFSLVGPTASPTGTWTNSSGTIVTMPFDPSINPPGIYTYTVDSLGCLDEAEVTVSEVLTEITSSVPVNANCNSADNGSVTINGVNIASYSLDGAAPVPLTTPFTISNLAPGSYSVEVFSADGCSDEVTFTISEPQPLQVSITTADLTVCPGTPVDITASGSGGSSAYTYTWIENGNPVGVGQTITVTPDALSNEYCVVLTEACGSPTATDCMTITTPEAITPVILPDTLDGCYPVVVNFTNTTDSPNIALTDIDFGDGSTGQYTGNQGFSHVYEAPGIYTVTVAVTSTVGCIYETVYTNLIQAYPYPEAYFAIIPNNISMFSPQVNLVDQSSSDVVLYNWFIPEGNPAVSTETSVQVDYLYGEPGNYPVTLVVENMYGCEDSITHVVNVLNDVLLYAPNTFTPDDDEFNQDWGIYITGISIANFSLFIFNRWGEIIWESHDAEAKWDGTYGGEIVQDGTYTWTVECNDANNDGKYTFSGHVNVIR